MRGIFGIIAAREDVVRRAVPAATEALAHRGPDDSGSSVVAFESSWLGLGHRRLAVLDPSPLGRQPMAHAETGCLLAFNGEIYNFRRLRDELRRDGEVFKSESDTEVLLAGLVRHRERFLSRLEGMYAFGFFDPRGPRVLIARDPAGIKPLYFAELSCGGLAFASETKAFIASGIVPPRLEPRGLAGLLAYGAVQHPFTLFRNVTSLAAGTFLVLESNGHAPRRTGTPRPFWRPPAPCPSVTEAEAVRSVRDNLAAAASDHLVSDVPVGLFLSSGIDSTILAGLIGGISPNLQSFTVALGGPEDEGRIAAETARRFGLRHTEVCLTEEEVRSWFEDWLVALDQPSIDGLNTFIVSRSVRQRGMKVAISGLGGDELFGGYPSFRDVPRIRRLSRLLRVLPPAGRGAIGAALAAGRPRCVVEKMREMFAGRSDVRSIYLRRRRLLSDRQMRLLGLNAADLGLDADYLAADAPRFPESEDGDPVRQISELEFRHYQGDMLLRDSDANGMAVGLEIRVPFLDQRLLDTVLAYPGRVRLPYGAKNKSLLCKAFPDLLRPAVVRQQKKGFVLPVNRWMAGPMRPFCERALADLRESGVAREGIDAVWSEFLEEPASPMWSRALALVVLADFIRRNDVT